MYTGRNKCGTCWRQSHTLHGKCNLLKNTEWHLYWKESQSPFLVVLILIKKFRSHQFGRQMSFSDVQFLNALLKKWMSGELSIDFQLCSIMGRRIWCSFIISTTYCAQRVASVTDLTAACVSDIEAATHIEWGTGSLKLTKSTTGYLVVIGDRFDSWLRTCQRYSAQEASQLLALAFL